MRIAFIEVSMGGQKSSDAMEPLVYAVLKGLTPDDVSLTLYDERLKVLPEDLDVDWVVASANSFTVKRAYNHLRHYASKGIKTAIGGVHATLIEKEAMAYADTVLVGDAESIWPEFLEDIQSGQAKALYKKSTYPDISKTYFDESIFVGKKYAGITPVQFSRGCKFNCDFCSVHALYKHNRRYRDIECVVGEIKRRQLKTLFFVDDNLFMDRENTLDLLKAIKPLNVKWGCQISIDVSHDDELLETMAASGCMAVLIGFESINIVNLKQMNKKINIQHLDYGHVIKRLKAHGLMVYGTFVIGYDGDTLETFDKLLDFAIEHNLMLANFNPLIPTVGTPLYERLKEEGRLIYDKWWLEENYKYGETVYIPKNMTAEELRDGCFRIRQSFNTYKSISKRLFKEPVNRRNSLFYLAVNLISKKEIQRKQGRVL